VPLSPLAGRGRQASDQGFCTPNGWTAWQCSRRERPGALIVGLGCGAHPPQGSTGAFIFRPTVIVLSLASWLCRGRNSMKGLRALESTGSGYARVSVCVPLGEVQAPKGWIGCDGGARAAVTRSDGDKGPALRSIWQRHRNRRAMDQKRGIARRVQTSPQRQVLACEARKVVLVAYTSGRDIALEDPKKLIRWKGHAARDFATRVALWASLIGVSVALIRPAYTSITCSCCGWGEKHQRHRAMGRW